MVEKRAPFMRRQRGRVKEATGNKKSGGRCEKWANEERAGRRQGLNKQDLMGLCFMRLQVSFLIEVIFGLWCSPPPSPHSQASPAHAIQVSSNLHSLHREFLLWCYRCSLHNRSVSVLFWLYVAMVAPTAARRPKSQNNS